MSLAKEAAGRRAAEFVESGMTVGLSGSPGPYIQRALLEFDVAGNMPAGMTILTAELQLSGVDELT